MKESIPSNQAARRVVIIGCKGSALNLIQQIKYAIKEFSLKWTIEGICIDNHLRGELINDIPVLSNIKEIPRILIHKELKFLFALYKPEIMKERYFLLQNFGIPKERFVNFIHPLSYISPDIKLGFGNIIFSNSVIQSGVTLGDYNFINSNVVIEHDTVIGNGNFIAAGAIIGSETVINNYNFIGLNSTIREKVIINESVFVGMGSVVLDNYSNAKVYGVPAKKISEWN